MAEESLTKWHLSASLRVLKSFKGNGLLEDHDVENIKTWNGEGGIFLYKELLMGRQVFIKAIGRDWKGCYDIQ